MTAEQFTKGQKAAAWGVHLFTASGILTIFMAILAVADNDLRAAMFWLLAAQVIDGVDGTLARKFRVTEVLPNMKGKNIDFVIDFAGYAIVPAYMIYTAELITGQWNLGIAFLILLTSAIYYGKEGMVSDDNYFVGFPVMWNLVAYCLIFVFDLTHWWNVLVIIALSILHFVPIRIAYPSRTKEWRIPTLTATVIGIAGGIALLYYHPQPIEWLRWIVIAVLGYFTVFAVKASL